MKLTDFLQDIGRPIAFYPGLRRITTRVSATLFLCQLIYWHGKQADKDGWIFKTSSEIEEETSLTYKEQAGARKHLVHLGYIEEKYERLDHVMLFRVCLSKIDQDWDMGISRNDLWSDGEMPDGEFGKRPLGSSLNESENTSQITTENTKRGRAGANAPRTLTDIDYSNLTVIEAGKIPEIRTFRDATGRFPGKPVYRKVVEVIRSHQFTAEYLTPFWEAWNEKGYNPRSLAWLTDWAPAGKVPVNGNGKEDEFTKALKKLAESEG